MSMDVFLAFSSEVTGFTEFDLLGTGQAPTYHSTVERVVGSQNLDDLLRTYQESVTELDDEQKRARQLGESVLDDPRLGVIARNIIKLWYSGTWFDLSPEWTAQFGVPGTEGTFTASGQAYAVGLLWFAVGSNPPGARAPGYGSWAQPPRIPHLPPSSIPSSLAR
ncbi:hypothetical protein [Kineosporia sp. NBRC 101731]|uniref:hypothetical protein n=1 Tax=Kineosporia sp. NBRC 101731 TaxID=3032199 RepID=UPI0024A328C9|nr:hypothetical protein [Kineosporia sp. NBRC 101731]GLY29225.1 hypothetical protein Kisp02_25900 [Kineosporia sp. NBRC 101731]